MRQHLANGELILDARDDLHRSAAVLAHGDVDPKKSRFNRCAHVMAMARGRLHALFALALRLLSPSALRRGRDLRAQAMMDEIE
jgi:hypothetical protein